MGTHWMLAARAEVNAQISEYSSKRAESPEAFGHSADGCWDNTPSHGPRALICAESDKPDAKWWILWGVHKHPWPLDYTYCFGRAIDSKGERSDPALLIDIRDLPKKYIGRFNIAPRRCNRNNHRTIFARALADGLDLSEYSEANQPAWTPPQTGSFDASDDEVPF